MIYLFTGTPRSGKSFHACKEIVKRLKKGQPVIANFPINQNAVRKTKSKIEYWDNLVISPQKFVEFSRNNNLWGKEGRALIVLDEAQLLFNCRTFGDKNRNKWNKFFTQHGKMGYDIILISHSDEFLDKQLRKTAEVEVRHMKLNNYGLAGLLISLTMMTWFVSISYWYGGNKALISRSIYPYNSRYEKVYDSYRLFEEFDLEGITEETAGAGAGGNRASGGARGESSGRVGSEDIQKQENKNIGLFQMLFPTVYAITHRNKKKKEKTEIEQNKILTAGDSEAGNLEIA